MGAQQLVTMTEIAEFAEVRRPTVSNWRRRHENFPEAVSGGSQPLFDADQIADWLDHRPTPDAAKHGKNKPTYGDQFRAGFGLRALTGRIGSAPGDALIRLGLALTALRAKLRRPLPPDPGEIHQLAAAVETAHPDLAGVFTTDLDAAPSASVAQLAVVVEGLITVAGPAEAAERLISSGDRVESALRATMTPDPVANLIANLAHCDVGGSRILDAAAGTGTLLLRVLGTRTSKAVTAADIDPDILRMLRHRLICSDVEADVVQADSLTEWADRDADLVLVDPPFISGERDQHTDGPLHWADQAARSLAPGGQAYVVVPAWALARKDTLQSRLRRSGERTNEQIRDLLVSEGAIRAVIQLPRRVHTFLTGTELVLLVLVADATDEVVLCNADLIATEHGDRWVEKTAQLVADRRAQPSAFFGRIPVEALPAGQSLLPSHRLTTARPSIDHLTQVWEAQQAARREFPSGEATLDRVEISARGRTEQKRVQALLDSGQLHHFAGNAIDPDHLGIEGVRVIGRDELLGARTPGSRAIDPLDLARYAAAALTEPGDVVILNEHGIHALVDEKGSSVVVPPLQVLRITVYKDYLRALRDGQTPEEPWMRPHVLARLLTTPRNATRQSGSLVRRVTLRELELPTLSPPEVAALDNIVRRFEQRAAELRHQATVLEDLDRAIVAGAADGVLHVEVPTAQTTNISESTTISETTTQGGSRGAAS